MSSVHKEHRRIEKKKVVKEMVHECRLPPEEDMLVRYIDSGYFVHLRRQFRKMMLVSERNPRSKFYLKSSFAIKREKETHLREHYNMIHPFSKFRFYWEVFMIFVLMFLLVLIPILLTQTGRSVTGAFIRMGLDAICIIDIVINFNTGYQHPNTKKIILDRKKVAIRYLKTWFFVDLISVINVDILMIYFYSETYLLYIRAPTVLKVLKIATLFMYLNRFKDYMQFNSQAFKMIKATIIAFLWWLWTTCLLYMTARRAEEKWLSDLCNNSACHLLSCVKRITNLFFLISCTLSTSLHVMRLEMACLAMGIILQLCLVVHLFQFVSRQMSSTLKYYSNLKQLNCFLDRKSIPNYMTKRIVEFFRFNYQRNFYKESEITATITTRMREEIQSMQCRKFAEKILLFQGLPHSMIVRISTFMTSEVFLPNDVIFLAGLPSGAMYFISSGTVAVYTPSGREIMHLTDGDSFGEASLVMEDQANLASVVAADYCDMYMLKRKDFVTVMEIYPDFYRRILKNATIRLAQVKQGSSDRDTPEFFDFATAQGQQAFYRRLYEL